MARARNAGGSVAAITMALLCGCGRGSSATADPIPRLALAPETGVTLPQDGRLADVRADILQRIDRADLVGLAVGVAMDGNVLWSEGFGWADRERQLPARPDSSFRLASLSKSLAATVLFTLVEDGRVSLDDRVNTLIAPLRLTGYGGADADAVTVRHLLATTGGVPHGWYVATARASRPDIQSLLPWFGMVVFPPGATWEYSNLSLGLTEAVVEAVTGTDYDTYARAAPFAPLGMAATATGGASRIATNLVAAYNARGDAIDDVGIDLPFGGLGMVSSVNDLLRFGRFQIGEFDHLGRPLVGEANRRVMQSSRSISPIFRLGWYDVNGDLVSNGSATGANSTLVIDPDENLVIVVLSNATSQNAVADTIAGAIKAHLVAPLPAGQGFGPEQYAAEYDTPYAPTPRLAGAWTGRFEWPDSEGLDVSMTFDDEGATLWIAGEEPVRVSGAVFNQHDRFEARVTFDRFPAFYPDDSPSASGRLSLQLLDGVLSGYVRIDRASATRRYGLPVFARLNRAPQEPALPNPVATR